MVSFLPVSDCQIQKKTYLDMGMQHMLTGLSNIRYLHSNVVLLLIKINNKHVKLTTLLRNQHSLLMYAISIVFKKSDLRPPFMESRWPYLKVIKTWIEIYTHSCGMENLSPCFPMDWKLKCQNKKGPNINSCYFVSYHRFY